MTTTTTQRAVVTTLPLHSTAAVCCMAWSKDEALLAAGACDGIVVVWEADTGLQRARLQCPQKAGICAITMSSDARLIAVAMGAACSHVF